MTAIFHVKGWIVLILKRNNNLKKSDSFKSTHGQLWITDLDTASLIGWLSMHIYLNWSSLENWKEIGSTSLVESISGISTGNHPILGVMHYHVVLLSSNKNPNFLMGKFGNRNNPKTPMKLWKEGQYKQLNNDFPMMTDSSIFISRTSDFLINWSKFSFTSNETNISLSTPIAVS